MDVNRPAVPNGVRRQLRQEAGFGCCLCGHPFLEYHHIIPWHEEQHFRAEDMMVLCGRCHHLCNVGAIPVSDQRRHKARPRNVVDDQTRGKLFVNAKELVVQFGGGTATNTPTLLEMGGEVILGAGLSGDDGRVLLRARVHDRDGRLVAVLDDNDWSMTPTDIWDFDCNPQQATIRLAAREIAFGVDVRNDRVSLRGQWFHNGTAIEFAPGHIQFGTNRLANFDMRDGRTMMKVL